MKENNKAVISINKDFHEDNKYDEEVKLFKDFILKTSTIIKFD